MLQDLTNLIGIDPNPAMEPYAQEAAAAAGLSPTKLQLQQGVAEHLPLPSASVDLVICTLVRFAAFPTMRWAESRLKQVSHHAHGESVCFI